MGDALNGGEAAIRLSSFLGVLVVMAAWEVVAPRRELGVRRPLRWCSNLGLVVLNTIAVRLLMPVTAVGTALLAEKQAWGLLHQIAWPLWIEVALSVIALDLVIYLQHVMFHAVPALWRLHMVHHADLDFDVTTGLRFHTLEILLSMLLKLAAVLVLGPPAVAVLIFEVLLNATSMFNHSNVRIPAWLDRVLRWLVVTPDMHRVHHSIARHETNSNFGFNLPWWDRLLGTYRPQPEAGHEGMTIGLTAIREERQVDRLPGMLLLPFRGDPGPYPISERAFRESAEGELPNERPHRGSVPSANPMDNLADEYDQWFDSPQGRDLFEIELASIRSVLGNRVGRWLEVGVGTGRFASALGIQEGVDPSGPALTLARSRGIDARAGAAERLPFEDGAFDGILLVTTLCFVADPRAPMREFRRALKRGGRLVIGMIPANGPWGRMCAEKGRQGHPFYSVAHFLTVSDVTSLAENAGFTLDSACSCLLSPPGSPLTERTQSGIVDDAGFVCVGFSAD